MRAVGKSKKLEDAAVGKLTVDCFDKHFSFSDRALTILEKTLPARTRHHH